MGTRLGGDGALLRRDTPEHDTENHVTENRPLLHGGQIITYIKNVTKHGLKNLAKNYGWD